MTNAPVVNANVKHNLNPNPIPNLNPYRTRKQTPNHHPHSNSLLLEISLQEQLSPEQMSDHQYITPLWNIPEYSIFSNKYRTSSKLKILDEFINPMFSTMALHRQRYDFTN